MTKWGTRFTQKDLTAMQLNKVPVNKYHNVITTVDNIKFRSKREANFYNTLKLLQKKGHVIYFHRQVRFDLPGNTAYYADFQVFNKDKTITYFDVKGKRLPAYIKNKKQVEALYPVEIVEV
jgi:hypothetical protein